MHLIPMGADPSNIILVEGRIPKNYVKVEHIKIGDEVDMNLDPYWVCAMV